MNESQEKTEVVQSVVPVSVADEIRKDAKTEDRSVSNVISRVLCDRYKRRIEAANRRAA